MESFYVPEPGDCGGMHLTITPTILYPHDQGGFLPGDDFFPPGRTDLDLLIFLVYIFNHIPFWDLDVI